MPGVIVTGSIRQHAGGLGAVEVEAATVCFGTQSGELLGSADGGRTWATVAARLPPILSVRCA